MANGLETNEISSKRSATAGFAYCVVILLLSIFFQKIALPGSDGRLALSVLGYAGLAVVGFVFGILYFSVSILAAYLTFILCGTISIALSTSPEQSLSAFMLIIVLQFPLVLRLPQKTLDYGRLLDFFNAVMTPVALLGILQFAAQFVIGSEIAFAFDLHSPQILYLEGYNRMNSLDYGSPYFKSNGVFTAEPSFFSQYLAVGIMIEATRKARAGRLAIYAVAILCSFSGTGPLMLAMALSAYVVRRGRIALLLVLSSAVVILFAIAAASGLTFLTDRINEFTTPGTSGYARFISPFSYIHQWILTDQIAFWVGRGPGTVREHFREFHDLPFDPTWAKIIYEYGFLGSLAYCAFFFMAIRGSYHRELKLPLVLTYFLLGGYAANSFILSLVAVLLCWTAEQEDRAAQCDKEQ